MVDRETQKTEYRNGEPFLFDGTAWRKAQLMTCGSCGRSWYIRKDREPVYLCRSCGTSGENNPMYGKKGWNSGTARYDKALTARRRKAKYVQQRGNKCEKCGIKDLPLPCYSFHHKNPEEKTMELSKMWNWCEAKIEAELEKCIMFCANCHKVLHRGDYRASDYLEVTDG